MDENKRDELILEIHGLVCAMDEKLSAVEKRAEEHTGRITSIELEVKTHSSWKSRMGGVWIALVITAGIISTVITLAISLARK